MKIRRALGFAVLAYLGTMVIGILIAVISAVDTTDPNAVLPARCRAVSSIAAIALTARMAHLYFRSSKVAKGIQQGFSFGIVAVMVGVVLDIITLVPSYGWDPLVKYYTMPIFPITLLLILLVCSLIGRRHIRA